MASLLAAAGAGVWLLSADHPWILPLRGASVLMLAAAAILYLASLERDAPSILRAWYLGSYMLLRQHERALRGLRAATRGQLAILLYLRDFEGDDLRGDYHALERLIFDAVDESQIVVSLASPATDPSIRLSPIPKFFTDERDWVPLVGHLVARAARIVVVVGGESKGVHAEIESILARDAAAKTLIVDRVDAQATHGDLLDPFPHRCALADFGRQNPVVRDWLGSYLYTTDRRQRDDQAAFEIRQRSRGMFYFGARLYVFGWRGVIWRTDELDYRNWTRLNLRFDVFRDIRQEWLELEQTAIRNGLASSPLRWTVGGAAAEHFREFNRSQDRRTQIENAAIVLGDRRTWTRLRRLFRGLPD